MTKKLTKRQVSKLIEDEMWAGLQAYMREIRLKQLEAEMDYSPPIRGKSRA